MDLDNIDNIDMDDLEKHIKKLEMVKKAKDLMKALAPTATATTSAHLPTSSLLCQNWCLRTRVKLKICNASKGKRRGMLWVTK